MVELKVYKPKHLGVIGDVWNKLEYEQVRPVRDGDVVVDAGAGIGVFTVKAATKARVVYAFEPEPENFKLLRLNTSNLKNIRIFQKALWSSSGTKKLVIHATNWGGHTFYPKYLRPDHRLKMLDVETVTLDEVINGKVTFLKIDVEGAELEVFKGATHILKKFKPFIAVELHSVSLFEQVKQYLHGFGYKLYEENPKVIVRTHCFKP